MEQKDLRRTFKGYEERRSVNDPFTIRTDIYKLCSDIIYEQISNQMHIPDDFEGVKEIKTAAYNIEELQPESVCLSVVKVNNEWCVCNKSGGLLPISSLQVQSLLNVEDALLEVWADILDWKKQWE